MARSEHLATCPHCEESIYGKDYLDGPGEYYHNDECESCDKPITVNVSYIVDIWIDKGHKDDN